MRAAIARWRVRASPREQALVAAAALLVIALAAWAFVLQPLARDLARTQYALAQARADLAHARRQAEEIAGLRSASPVGGDVRADAERVLAQQHLRAQLTALKATAERVEITFEAVDFAALTGLVDALGREAALFPDEVLLAARTAPGSVRAEMAFVRRAAR